MFCVILQSNCYYFCPKENYTSLPKLPLQCLARLTAVLFLFLQDDYLEHKACITHCRFNNSGQKMATADVDGVVK